MDSAAAVPVAPPAAEAAATSEKTRRLEDESEKTPLGSPAEEKANGAEVRLRGAAEVVEAVHGMNALEREFERRKSHRSGFSRVHKFTVGLAWGTLLLMSGAIKE